MAFDISAKAKRRSETRYQPMPRRLVYVAYAQIERSEKKALRTSLRSEIHATDSTCSGCKPKRAATTAPGHGVAFARRRSVKMSRVLPM